jgi:dTMP kinase
MAMSELKRRGAFILFEGADRCGKSTHSRKLLEYFEARQIPAQRFAFPNRSSMTGKLLDEYLQGGRDIEPHVVHLMFSANRWECATEMTTLLESGVTLVVDRYAYSGIAYSVAKKAIPLAWACQADVGLPAPDVIFYLSAPFEELQQREGFGSERFDTQEFQTTVQHVFANLRHREPDPSLWRVIETCGSMEETHQRIVEIAGSIRDTVAATPIRLLSFP